MRGKQWLTGTAALMSLVLVAACGGAGSTAVTTATSVASTSSSAIAATTTAAASTTAAVPEPTTTQPAATTTTTVAREPTTTTAPAPVLDPNCPTTAHAAVIDRDRQRAYLCDHGIALPEFVITTAIEQPDPGVYPVYAKTMNTSSRFGGHYSTMTHFVAFTRGKRTGARIAFHTVPVLTNGQYAQPLESVGEPDRRGESAGCIRVLPDQGPVIWDWLQKGDEVQVLN